MGKMRQKMRNCPRHSSESSTAAVQRQLIWRPIRPSVHLSIFFFFLRKFGIAIFVRPLVPSGLMVIHWFSLSLSLSLSLCVMLALSNSRPSVRLRPANSDAILELRRSESSARAVWMEDEGGCSVPSTKLLSSIVFLRYTTIDNVRTPIPLNASDKDGGGTLRTTQ